MGVDALRAQCVCVCVFCKYNLCPHIYICACVRANAADAFEDDDA